MKGDKYHQHFVRDALRFLWRTAGVEISRQGRAEFQTLIRAAQNADTGAKTNWFSLPS